MKKNFLLIFFIVLSISPIKAQQEIITNQSVLDMISIGFTEDIIITKINTSQCEFNTSMEDLKSLKEKGVSSKIIVAMINAAKDVQQKADDAVNATSGIFYKKDGQMIRIHPTTFTGTKANPYGIAGTKVKSIMLRETSNNIVDTTLPEFYFIFERKKNESHSWWFSVATSPNQFALVKLKVRNKRRELETGKINLYTGTSIGVNEENCIKFHITEITPHEYKVVPESPLEAGGEYCFFYQGIIPQGGYTNQVVFDFSTAKVCKSSTYPVGSYVYVLIGDKIKNCVIKEVIIRDGEIHYAGETTTFKKVEWTGSCCSLDKEELKASILGEIDGIRCRSSKKYYNGMTICTTEKLIPEQIKKAKEAFSLKGKIKFHLEGSEGKGEAYAGIDDGFIIIYESNEFIKLN